MTIDLVYLQRCGNGVILYTREPVEYIVVTRQVRQHGPDKITKTPVIKNELDVPPGGEVSLELTQVNAAFIKYAIDAGLFELAVDDQMELVEAMLKGKKTRKKADKAEDAEDEEEVQEEELPAGEAKEQEPRVSRKKGSVVTV